jgi:tight adherence protein B
VIPIILSVCLSVFAVAVLAIMTLGSRASKRVSSRLAAFDPDLAGEVHEDSVTDIRKRQLRLSAIPWLNQWLTKVNLSSACSLFLYQAGVTLTLGTLILLSVTGAVFSGYAMYSRSGDKIPAMLVSAALFQVPFYYVRRKRNKRLLLLEQQLPEALSMIASALRVGHSLVAGLGAVAQESPEPIGSEIRKCFEEQNYGIDLRTSLTSLTRRVPVQDFRIFVAAVLIQRESGGNLAEVLEKVVQTARERFRLKKQVSVHTAQGRMTGWVLSLLPLVIGFAMYLMNPDGMSILWKRDIGLKMLYAATGMDVVGALIIRKIVSIRI